MTETIKLKNTGMVLSEEQLDTVTGGIGVETVVGALKTAIITGMDVYKEVKNLVNSKAYASMTDKEKNKAIGKIFANNVPFGIMVGAGAGLIYAQTKWRFAGVSDAVREGAEKLLKA